MCNKAVGDVRLCPRPLITTCLPQHRIKSYLASCGRVNIAQAGGDGSLVNDHNRRAEVYAMHHHVKSWRHTQNRKYITYCTVVRGEPIHTHRVTCVENCVKFKHMAFEICEMTDRYRDKRKNRQTYRQADRNTSPSQELTTTAAEVTSYNFWMKW